MPDECFIQSYSIAGHLNQSNSSAIPICVIRYDGYYFPGNPACRELLSPVTERLASFWCVNAV